MLELFLGDTPIRRRLWMMLLILVLGGALSSGAVSFSEKPVELIIQSLLFYGQVVFYGLFISLPMALIGDLVTRVIIRSREKSDPYRVAVGKNITDYWLGMITNLGFIIAVLIAVPQFGTPRMTQVGSIGIFLLLVSHSIGDSILRRKTIELLHLKEDSGKIEATVFAQGHPAKTFQVPESWLGEIAQLLNSGWVIVEFSNCEHPEAVLSRICIQTLRFSKHGKLKPTRVKRKHGKGKT